MFVSTCVLGALQTFHEVVVGFCPAVSVVGGEDPNGFFVSLEGGVPNLLQLNEELVSSKGRSITVVNIQLKELKVRRQGQRQNMREDNYCPTPETGNSSFERIQLATLEGCSKLRDPSPASLAGNKYSLGFMKPW